MKKIIIILGILMCFSLTGCTSTNSGYKNYDIYSHLISIEGENDLYYYSTTSSPSVSLPSSIVLSSGKDNPFNFSNTDG